MSTYLGHLVKVENVPYSNSLPTRVNIKKRRENFFFKTLTNEDNVNISYIIGQEITPTNNLSISDRSTSLNQNRILTSSTPVITTTSSLNLNVAKFLVTDIFTSESPTKPETPLFYKHSLTHYNDSLADFSNLTLLSVEFADYSLNSKNLTEYYLDASTGYLYNNIDNTYQENTGTADITFVQYAVRNTADDGTQTVSIYHELISNVPVYGLAGFDDLDSNGKLLTTIKKYTLEENPGGDTFLITLPTTQRYAYQEIIESRIKLLSPVARDMSAPWNIRVTNGQFITSLEKTIGAYEDHQYYLPEFDSQNFSPIPPYKVQFEQLAVWITKNLISLPKNIAADPGLGVFVEVQIYDETEDLVYAYTNDPTKIGDVYEGDILYTDGILSIDKKGGFIELLDDIQTDYNVYVTYYTEENEYEFNIVDFNPANNREILTQKVVLYINPQTAATGTLDESLHYLIVNTLGEILYSSQATTTATDGATQKLLAEDFLSDGTPRRTFYYDTESTASGLEVRVDSGVNMEYVSEFSFVDKYSVESVLLDPNIYPSASLLGTNKQDNFRENARFLLLGDVTIGEGVGIPGLTDFDVRVNGGGLKERYKEQAILQQPEAAWYWDCNAQTNYPGAGAFYLEVPQTVLEEHGGSFTSNQVKDIVNRHMKAGGYAAVNFYGIDPSITGIVVASGSATVTWPTYGSGIQYTACRSKDPVNNFIQVNHETLTDDGTSNSYVFSGLQLSTNYYVKIGARDSSLDESFSQTLGFTTTASGIA